MGGVTEPCTRTRYRQVKRGFPQLLEIFTLTAAKHLGGWFWNRAREWQFPHRPLLCSAQQRGLGGRELSHFTGVRMESQGRERTVPRPHNNSVLWGLGWKVLRPESTDTVL